MKNQIKPVAETTAPRKLEKPVRETQEMDREQLVTYANEGGVIQGTNGPIMPN
jgi:hypothetical protein